MDTLKRLLISLEHIESINISLDEREGYHIEGEMNFKKKSFHILDTDLKNAIISLLDGVRHEQRTV